MSRVESIYQELAVYLNQIICAGWTKILFYGEASEGYTSFHCYLYDLNNQPLFYKDALKDSENRESRIKRMQTLSNFVADLYESFKEETGDSFTNFTFILNNDGKFKIDYAYDDIFRKQDYVNQRRIEWIKKYIPELSE